MDGKWGNALLFTSEVSAAFDTIITDGFKAETAEFYVTFNDELAIECTVENIFYIGKKTGIGMEGIGVPKELEKIYTFPLTSQ